MRVFSQVLPAAVACLILLFDATARADTAAPPPPAAAHPVRYATDDASHDILLPTTPGDHKLKFKTHVGDRAVEMSYLLHLPPHYNDDTRKTRPMLVFLHGIGECGTDLAGVYALGPMTLLKADGGNPVFAAACPFVVLCPQCPPRGQTWDTDYMIKATAELIDLTIKRTRTDPDRVCVTGLSMGGLGSWCVSEEMPDLFAAVAPLSAMQWQPDQAAAKLKNAFIWAVAGNNDEFRFINGARSMDAALSKDPVVPRFTYFLDKGHDAWFPPYQSVGFYEWLLDHRRPTPEQRKKLDAGGTIVPPVAIPTVPGHYLLQFDTTIGHQPYQMDYLLYLPKSYKPGTPVPAILSLNELETIGPEYKNLCMHGPDMVLEKHPVLQNNFDFAVISPRAPIDCDWNTGGMTTALLALLDHVASGITLDTSRISVTGINAGAVGAIRLADEAPDRFSAVTPIITSAGFNPDGRPNVLRNNPGRFYVRAGESALFDQITQMIKGTKSDWKVLKMPTTASPTVDISAYSDRVYLTWLAQQRRGTQPVSQAK